MSTIAYIVVFALTIIVLVGNWRVYEKAGQPGWATLIPIVNLYFLLQIAKKPTWWMLLLIVPFVNIVIAFIINIEVAKNFGRSAGFGVGLTLLNVIFIPILGFGDDKYLGGDQDYWNQKDDIIDSDLVE